MRKYFRNDPWKVDNVLDKANFSLDSSTVIPVRVRYKNENAFHESMAHFWKEWNQEYFMALDSPEGGVSDNDSTKHSWSNSTNHSKVFPRLMVRLEDLVFFPQQVLKVICDCVGGQLADPLVLAGNTSKKGGENIHGRNKTDLRMAMISHVYTNRSLGMTQEDMDYASKVLETSQVLQLLGYPSHPQRTTPA